MRSDKKESFEHLHSKVNFIDIGKTQQLSAEQVFVFMNDKNEQLFKLAIELSTANQEFDKQLKLYKICFAILLFFMMFFISYRHV